jgi:hypothetical protein
LIGTIVALAGLIVFNLGYWLAYPAWNQSNLVQPDQMAPAGSVAASVPTSHIGQQVAWAVVVIIAIVLASVGGWIAVVKIQSRQRVARNQLRRQDLGRLQQGLEAYKSAVGHYPVGAATQPRLVPAAALGYEWESLGFPSGSEMKKYVPDWPVVDPLVSYDQHQQRNQYLYYPLQDGQSYALYAHLESINPHEVLTLVNQTDGLPNAWGDYNLKVERSTGEQPSQVQPVVVAPAAAQPVEVAVPLPAPVAVEPAPVNVPPAATPPTPGPELVQPVAAEAPPPADSQPLSEAEMYRLGQSASEPASSSPLPAAPKQPQS